MKMEQEVKASFHWQPNMSSAEPFLLNEKQTRHDLVKLDGISVYIF